MFNKGEPKEKNESHLSALMEMSPDLLRHLLRKQLISRCSSVKMVRWTLRESNFGESLHMWCERPKNYYHIDRMCRCLCGFVWLSMSMKVAPIRRHLIFYFNCGLMEQVAAVSCFVWFGGARLSHRLHIHYA